ncbi:MAG TPA: YraN family protein [Chitinophagaceae bacterium]
MASHNDLGKEGEQMAVDWLLTKEYTILHRNWRHSYYEIDIIATKKEVLHIIEVKIRHHSPFGHPEDSVTRKKFKDLQRAVDEFLFQNPGHKWLQYGILAITLFKDKEPEFFLLEDVYL